MSYTVRWRKAIALSVFLHVFLGVAVGYMTIRLTVSPPADEQIIDLMVNTLLDDPPVDPEPQMASPNLPVAEVVPTLPPDDSLPTEPSTVASNEIEDLPTVVIKAAPAGSDTPTVVNSSKHNMLGTPPVVLVRADPVYPSEVDQIGRKIIVVLRMRIMENGSPGKIEVAVSSGQKSINDAAIAAAKKWRFEPAKDRDGHPVVCSTILSIPFTPQ